MPVLPMQFGPHGTGGGGGSAGAFMGGAAFPDSFDVFANAAAAAAAAASSGAGGMAGDAHKMGGSAGGSYADAASDMLKPTTPDMLYENRAKLEFLRRNMDAFRRGSHMDIFGAEKAEFFESLNRDASQLLGMRPALGAYGVAANGLDASNGARSSAVSAAGLEGATVAAVDGRTSYYGYCNDDDADADEDGDDDDESCDDKIDVVNESECDEKPAGRRHSIKAMQMPPKPFANNPKARRMLLAADDGEHHRLGAGHHNEAMALSGRTAEDDERTLERRVYASVSSPSALVMDSSRVAISSRSSNASAEYGLEGTAGLKATPPPTIAMVSASPNVRGGSTPATTPPPPPLLSRDWPNNNNNNEHQHLVRNAASAATVFGKRCFESTLLDYEDEFVVGATQKKRKYGNAKGFSIENLIGSGVGEA